MTVAIRGGYGEVKTTTTTIASIAKSQATQVRLWMQSLCVELAVFDFDLTISKMHTSNVLEWFRKELPHDCHRALWHQGVQFEKQIAAIFPLDKPGVTMPNFIANAELFKCVILELRACGIYFGIASYGSRMMIWFYLKTIFGDELMQKLWSDHNVLTPGGTFADGYDMQRMPNKLAMLDILRLTQSTQKQIAKSAVLVYDDENSMAAQLASWSKSAARFVHVPEGYGDDEVGLSTVERYMTLTPTIKLTKLIVTSETVVVSATSPAASSAALSIATVPSGAVVSVVTE